MNVLDEDIPGSQRQFLRSWGIRVRQIGQDSGRSGMSDEEIIPLLHQLPHPTFFTRDAGFYSPRLRHPAYCLVCLYVGQYEAASFVRRFLHHRSFDTIAKRLGKVVRVSHTGLHLWSPTRDEPEVLDW